MDTTTKSISRVLIVDDDPQRRAWCLRMLSPSTDCKYVARAAGWTGYAGEAETSQQARRIVRCENPDCIILFESNARAARLRRGPAGPPEADWEVLHTLKSARAAGSTGSAGPEISAPIIVLVAGGAGSSRCAAATQAAAIQALEHGAAQVLFTDNLSPQHLVRAVECAIEHSALRRDLDQARVMVESKNRQLSELQRSTHQWAEKVAHSFRAPLTVTRQLAAIVQDAVSGEVNDEQRKYLARAAGSTGHAGVIQRIADLHTTIDDLLNISKLESGSVGVLREDCTVEQIIDHIRTTVVRKAALSHGSLEYALDDHLPDVYCDPKKIGQVIITLVANALRASERGSAVRIWARHEETEAEVVVGVTDTGPGIDPQIVRIITEQFQGSARAAGSTARPASELEGYGLGLNIAKELVQLNLGEISVQSQLGGGTTFSFTVPTADPPRLLLRYLDKIKPFRSDTMFASLLEAEVDQRIDPEVLDDVARFLQNRVRRSDLVFRTRSHTWLLVIPTNQRELEPLTNRLARAWEQVNRQGVEDQLPPIRIEVLGTWRLSDQKDQLVKRFEMESRVPAGLTV